VCFFRPSSAARNAEMAEIENPEKVDFSLKKTSCFFGFDEFNLVTLYKTNSF